MQVLSFNEPPSYKPRDAWYEKFSDKVLTMQEPTRSQVDAVSGATLTVNATSDALQEALAIHHLLYADPS